MMPVKKQILVLGGSYFIGRVFSILSSKRDIFEAHVVNRGNYPLNRPDVKEYKCDRHDAARLAKILPDIKFDAAVDFCGLESGDISLIIDSIGRRISQYIFISSCAIYDVSVGSKRTEKSTLYERRTSGGPVSMYTTNKLILEDELINSCVKRAISYTILRLPFVYGPFNYAPRESFFIEKILKGGRVPVLTDSTSKFSFLYVEDVAYSIERIVSDSRAANEIFNLVAPECVTYASFIEELQRINGSPFEVTPMTVSQAESDNVAFPFPLNEDATYSGEKFSKTFDFSYTPLHDGMKKTFDTLKKVYGA
jgi:nucleoside-diphosphate-sugar epimerase